MAYIYQITNDINDKIYIGKTEFNIQKRFKEHCSDAFRNRNEKRPLYAAMRKYGIEHFSIELIEETDNPEEREKYWIKEKNSYHNGYNATLGGDGAHYIDYDKVIELYQKYQNQVKVSQELNICVDSIHSILVENNIPIVIPETLNKKEVFMYKDSLFIKSFPSLRDAAKYIINNNFTTSKYPEKVASNIGRAVDEKQRKTAFGYRWKSKLE